jgi:hypothetical protein
MGRCNKPQRMLALQVVLMSFKRQAHQQENTTDSYCEWRFFIRDLRAGIGTHPLPSNGSRCERKLALEIR